MCFDERVGSSSFGWVCCAVDCHRGPSGAGVPVAVVVAAVALFVVPGVAVAGVTAVVDGGVSVATVGLGCIKGGWGLDWRGVGRVGSECRRFQAVAIGLGWDAAEVSAVDKGDVAVVLGGLILGTGVRGPGWGGQGGVWTSIGLRCDL